MSRAVAVVHTGTANLASMLAALRRLGAEPSIARDARAVEAADRLVLPGVGSFGAAMATLWADGLVEPLRRRLADGRPTLAVCVGLQVLFETSEESPRADGLGVLPGRAGRFPPTVRVPQLGWNQVEPDEHCRLVEPGHAYFANSFRVTQAPVGARTAFADHGGRFVAGFELGALLALQCHPELSGRWGLALLERWLAGPPC